MNLLVAPLTLTPKPQQLVPMVPTSPVAAVDSHHLHPHHQLTNQLLLKASGIASLAPYLDPRSPQYRRLMCVTYTYKAKMPQALLFHQTTGRQCDMHLVFTNRYAEGIVEGFELGLNNIVKRLPRGGESYLNMWQKTLMIMDHLEYYMRDDNAPYRRGGDGRTSTTSSSSSSWGVDNGGAAAKKGEGERQHKSTSPSPTVLVVGNDTDPYDVLCAVRSALAYDYIAVGGDDVVMSVPQLRRYISQIDSLHGAPITSYKVKSDAINGNGEHGRPNHPTPRHSSHDGTASISYRAPTTPHHMGLRHRTHIIGGTYIMNKQGYLTYMTGARRCHSRKQAFREDYYISACHNTAATIHRHATSFGIGEHVMSFLPPELVAHVGRRLVSSPQFIPEQFRAWPRGTTSYSKDGFGFHYIKGPDMANVQDVYFNNAVGPAPEAYLATGRRR